MVCLILFYGLIILLDTGVMAESNTEEICQGVFEEAKRMGTNKVMEDDIFLTSYVDCKELYGNGGQGRSNFCQLQLFTNQHFTGNVIAVKNAKRVQDYRTNIQSIRVVGNCCYEIYKRGEHWKNLQGTQQIEILGIPLTSPFLGHKIPCSNPRPYIRIS